MSSNQIETPIIMNITKGRYETTMDILEGIKNKKIEMDLNTFIRMEDKDKEEIYIKVIAEMQKSAATAMDVLSDFEG